MSGPGTRARVSVALTIVVLSSALAVALAAAVGAQHRAEAAHASAKAEHTRLLGLRDAGPGTEVALAEAAASLARHAYAAAVDPRRAGTDLQRRLRANAEQAGLAVSASRILPVEQGAEIDAIRVSITLEGSLEQLQLMLLLAGNGIPTATADSVIIHPVHREGRNRELLVMQASFGAARLTR